MKTYEPFHGWLFAGEPQEGYSDIIGASRGHDLTSLPIGVLEHDPRPIFSSDFTKNGGFAFYRRALSALEPYDAGHWAVYLECKGPATSYAGLNVARERKVLWIADARVALHRYAVWCARQYVPIIKSKAALKRAEEAIAAKEEAIGAEHATGAKWAGEACSGNPVLNALGQSGSRRCVLKTWEAVRLALPGQGYPSLRGRFARDSYGELERLLLELASNGEAKP